MAIYCITGIAGFIGSSLARALVDRGEEVRGIDNLSGGTIENLGEHAQQIDLHVADICDLEVVRETIHGSDFVLHQAAIASVPRSIQDPLTSHQTNVNGTLNVLLASREAGVKRVVFAASSSVYGDQPAHPKTESMVPCPLSPYAIQKLTGELYMQGFSRTYGVPTVCLRYFNIFGPRQAADSPYSGVIAKFIRAMQQGRAPQICGDGTQTRDFTYISNAVAANLLACVAPVEAVCGRVFNVGTGREHTINRTCSSLARLLAFNGPPVYTDPRPGDIQHSLASIEMARQYLDYAPEDDFEEGLRKTVEWYQSTSKQKASNSMAAD